MKDKQMKGVPRSEVSERSLVRQAVSGIVLAEIVCMVVMATVSIGHERQARLRALDLVLEGRADSVFGAIQDAEDDGDNVQLDKREMEIPDEDLFAVYDQNGHRIGGSPGTLKPARVDHGDPTGFHNQQWDGRSYRVLSRQHLRVIDRAETNGAGLERPVTILYAMPLDHIWKEVFEGISFFLGMSLLLTLGTMTFMVALMRRVLKPIEELAAAAAAVSPRELLFQVPQRALTTRELRPLALALIAMLQELREAFEKQHQFLGDAAHELKTAVAVVRSSLQLLLLRKRSPEAYEEGVRLTVQDNARAEELIARMLLMARLEEPGERLRTTQADLCSAVQTCLRRLTPLAEQAGIRLVQHRPPLTGEQNDCESTGLRPDTREQSALVPVSSSDLEVLVSNLLVNAVEHSLPGSFVVATVAKEHDHAVLRVIDEGEGISKEAQEHVFERFYRVDQSRARGTGGAGLGLSITKAIVDVAHGSIAVLSGRGEGTTITVRLPLSLQEDRSAELAPI